MSIAVLNTGIKNISGRTLLRNSGVIINAQVVKYNTEIAFSNLNQGIIFSVTCTKLLSASLSDLHVIWKIPGCGTNSYVCGSYISVGGVISYDNRYFYSAYAEPDGALWGNEVFNGVPSGTQIPITVGWSSADSTANFPYTYINPIQGRNDARRRGPASSNFLIFEVVK
jgi:hypothetical protein